jgi:hypothetical protein
MPGLLKRFVLFSAPNEPRQQARHSMVPLVPGHWRPIPDILGARLHAASTLSLNYIRLAHPPGGLHEPLLDHADESETTARDSPCLGPSGVFQFR